MGIVGLNLPNIVILDRRKNRSKYERINFLDMILIKEESNIHRP